MKRVLSTVVALATAVSLSTAAAPARESSDVSGAEALAYGSSAASNDNLTSSARKFKEDKLGSSGENNDGPPNVAESAFIISSLKNDAAKGYPAGTTVEILMGTGIAVLVLAIGGAVAHAVNTGMIKIPGR